MTNTIKNMRLKFKYLGFLLQQQLDAVVSKPTTADIIRYEFTIIV